MVHKSIRISIIKCYDGSSKNCAIPYPHLSVLLSTTHSHSNAAVIVDITKEGLFVVTAIGCVKRKKRKKQQKKPKRDAQLSDDENQ